MHSLSLLGPGLLAIIGILLFVAPFLDLLLSRRLQAAPTGQRRLLLYRLAIAYLWVLAGLAWVCRDGTEVHVLHAAGDAAWLFGSRWRTWTFSAILVLFFAFAFKPGVDVLLRPRRVQAGWNHLYQGWKAVGSTAVIGLAFGLLALLSGNLLIPIPARA